MGTVVPIRQLDPSASVQKTLDDLHTRSKAERFRGFLFLLETPDGEQVVGASGVFAADLDRAAAAGKAGLECLLGVAGYVEPPVQKSHAPRRLRKEMR